MIAPKLVRLIETHSEQLARNLLQKFEASGRFPGFYKKVPPGELQQRAYEIYRNLGDWLLWKTERDVERRYTAVGARRHAQGVALSELMDAILFVKEHLWEFLKLEGLVDRPVDLFQELELFHLVDQFFDRAVHYAAVGYEQAERARLSHAA